MNAFQFLSVINLIFGNVSCLYNNLGQNIFDSDLGSCFVFYEVQNLVIASSIIKFCYSEYATTGVRIAYSDIDIVLSNYSVKLIYYKFKFIKNLISLICLDCCARFYF